jgi:hypothetical protein
MFSSVRKHRSPLGKAGNKNIMRRAISSVRSGIVVAVGFNPRWVARMVFLAPVEPVLSLSKEAAYFPDSILPRWSDMPLPRSLWFFRLSQPPVETGGYKDYAPTERAGTMTGAERPRFLDLTMRRATFKRAAVEDVSGNRRNYYKSSHA